MSTARRDELLAALLRESRRLGGQLVVSRQGPAEALGLNAHDLLCLEMVSAEEPVSAGRLAEQLQLTTGAVTGVVDRLEEAGFVRRERDADDRRRVLVRIASERQRELAQILDPLASALGSATAGAAERDLQVVLDFVSRLRSGLVDETARAAPAPPGTRRARAQDRRGEFVLPRDGLADARLDVATGFANVSIDTDPGLAELLRGRFGSHPPAVDLVDGTVRLQSPRPTLWRGWSGSGQLTLNGAVSWGIALRSGASNVRADLRDLSLTALEVRGGASRVEVSLPAPAGTVPIRVSGGASRLTLDRPAGTALRLRMEGGASKVEVDRFQLGSVGGGARWQTPDFDAAAGRYDLTIEGGAGRLTVRTR
ncbi:MAG: MarR family transcriptional regulator [Candidatus Dormibacteraeota bacterium]|nr:MarR family transcriptional regulator [Candidatus Dormibacteraeota bacterium]MBO0760872.1 MarR family transcriptional regulator [Candidatus Dormibacteraeota bacterium]